MNRGRGVLAVATVVLALVALAGLSVPGRGAGPQRDPGEAASVTGSVRASPTASVPPAAPRSDPLGGLRIALDPGHQAGNRNFGAQTARLVPAGGFSKPCNTTGTSTSDGYAEADLTFAVARSVARRLRDLGAEVFLTRSSNSADRWGPCVDARGRFGAAVGAVLAVSLHADGAARSERGFHVIMPTSRAPWTTDIAAESRRLAYALRAGLDARGIPRATYLGRGTGLVSRSDLATLNLSDVPIVMVEVGNMRNPSDAARMTSGAGRASYADAVVDGIRRYLAR